MRRSNSVLIRSSGRRGQGGSAGSKEPTLRQDAAGGNRQSSVRGWGTI